MIEIHNELMIFANEQAFLFYFFLFLLGSAIGSFLNVVAFRTPISMKHGFIQNAIDIIEHFNLGEHSIKDNTEENYRDLGGRSHCPACSAKIPFYHNIPVFSWFILVGKCINCKSKISFRYPLVEFISGVLLASLVHLCGFEFGVYLFAIFSLLYVIACCDNAISVIPTGHVLVIGVIGLLMTCRGGEVTTIDALTISITTFVLLSVLARFFAFGEGDILLYSAVAIVVGQNALWVYVLAGISATVLYLINRKKVTVGLLGESKLVQYGPSIAISGAFVAAYTHIL
jgi:leader peptidase (prepilin peptidase)/N-methyltransferase